MSEQSTLNIPKSELASVAHVVAILLRDGDSESSRTLVSQLQTDTDLGIGLSLDSAGEHSPFSGIERDVYLRHSAYVHRDRRASLDDELATSVLSFGVKEYSLPRDHLAQELFILATMMAGDRFSEAITFAEDYIAKWIVPVAAVVQRESHVADRMAIDVCLSLLDALLDQSEKLSEDHKPVDSEELATIDWTDLIKWLPYPDLTGMFVSRSQLSTLARKANVPVGFGSRSQMVELLIDGAVRYNSQQVLRQGLLEILDTELTTFRMIEQRLPEANCVVDWIGRLENTYRLVELLPGSSKE
ncbi:MAG: hypothetical protein HKN43_10125 [Rhodothermales bacterium]|nr:hypothetical protein [Rhodothermales bacterium]